MSELQTGVIRIPKTLTDADDGLILIHWIADVLEATANSNDKAYIVEDLIDENIEEEYIELFVRDHLLREFIDRTNDTPLYRFEIHRDNTSGPIAFYRTLKEAVFGLLELDNRTLLESEWQKRFGKG